MSRMVQNGTKFQWNMKRERAALLVAEDKLTDEAIACELEIGRQTLVRWKKTPEFKARVSKIIEKVRAKLESEGLRNKRNRLKALNERWEKMAEVIRQRAQTHKDIASGGNTGLLVRQVKGIGKGEDFQVVEEYAVDTGLLREMREHEKQAAVELGEWTEKREHTFNLTELSDEDLIALEGITAKLTQS